MPDTRGYSVSAEFSTIGASVPSGMPDVCGNPPAHPVWYQYCVDGNGLVDINTDESDFDTCVAIYSGPAHPASFSQLTEIACNSDVGKGAGIIGVGITALQNYFIVVDGVDGASGEVVLRVTVQQNYFEDAGGSSSSSSSSVPAMVWQEYTW